MATAPLAGDTDSTVLIVNGELVADVNGKDVAVSVYEPAVPVMAHPENDATPLLAASGLLAQLRVAPEAGWVLMDRVIEAEEPVTTLLY